MPAESGQSTRTESLSVIVTEPDSGGRASTKAAYDLIASLPAWSGYCFEKRNRQRLDVESA